MTAHDRADTDLPPLYRERLLPSAPMWVVGAAGGGLFGLILVPISVPAGIIVSVLMAAGVCLALGLTSPLIEVTERTLSAGPARIGAEDIGDAAALDRSQWEYAMGVGFQPLAYHCTRPWIHTGVRISVTDEADPAPAWVLASRRPEALASAIEAMRIGRPLDA